MQYKDGQIYYIDFKGNSGREINKIHFKREKLNF